MAKTLNERAAYLDKLENANDRALKAMARLRQAVEAENPNKALAQYNLLLRNLYWMGAAYRMLDRDLQYVNFAVMLDKIEQRTGDYLGEALARMRLGASSKIDLEEKVERISYTEESCGYDVFNVCRTFHDLIRCLHASSLNAFFSGIGLEDKIEEKGYNAGHFHILRGDNGKNSDLLDAIVHLYETNVKKSGSESYKIVVVPELLSAKVNMGCHFSTINLSLKGDKGALSLKFGNTSAKQYPNAPNRAEYVRKVMEQIGFTNVESFGDLVVGAESGISRKELVNLLKESVRMLASTKDLDVSGCGIAGRVDEAVKAFMSGKTNIFEYLAKSAEDK